MFFKEIKIKQPSVKLVKKEYVTLFEEENIAYNYTDIEGIIRGNEESNANFKFYNHISYVLLFNKN